MPEDLPDLSLASFPGYQRDLVDPDFFFLGTRETFFPLEQWTTEEGGTQRENLMYFSITEHFCC